MLSMVAKNCSQFTNSTGSFGNPKDMTCSNCAHWDGYCELNLFDMIENSIQPGKTTMSSHGTPVYESTQYHPQFYTNASKSVANSTNYMNKTSHTNYSETMVDHAYRTGHPSAVDLEYYTNSAVNTNMDQGLKKQNTEMPETDPPIVTPGDNGVGQKPSYLN